MSDTLHIHLGPGYDRSLCPVPAAGNREWFELDDKTRNHAQHCLPMRMANSCGYFILSPAQITVSWDGEPGHEAVVTVHEAAPHTSIDTKTTYGSVTVQAGFSVRTDDIGDFVWIKDVPNERDLPFTCMESLLEAWDHSCVVSLVLMLKRAGTFTIERGSPIAQMALYKGEGRSVDMDFTVGMPDEHNAHAKRRTRPEYKKDFDYMRGRRPDGSIEPTHIMKWSQDPMDVE